MCRIVRFARSVSCCIFVFFVFIMPAKRKSLCPGCKTPKQNHAFAAPSKHCAGPPVASHAGVFRGGSFFIPPHKRRLWGGTKKRAPLKTPAWETRPLVKNEILDDELSAGKELPPSQGKSVSSPSAESSPQKQLESQQLLFCTRCGICSCGWKTSRQSRRK